jgi:hypothetical protein
MVKLHKDNSWTGGSLSLLILGTGAIIAIAGSIWTWNHFMHPTNKTWWNGTTAQQVCAIDQPTAPSRTCYTLDVRSDGGRVTTIYFTNGGYITAASSDCYKAGTIGNYGNDRFCRVYDAQGRQWEVDHATADPNENREPTPPVIPQN